MGGLATVKSGALLLLCLGFLPGSGSAQARDFCPDRPGVGTTPCTIERGRVAVELSLADRTWDRQPDRVTDTVVAGDLALRAGISDHMELRLGWTPYGRGSEEDRATGEDERMRGIGAVVLGFKRNHYDRLVHFCFGLLLAYPVREVLVRGAELRGAWSYVLAACVIMAASSLFELLEWLVAETLGGNAGQNYIAAQGDEWDAHKDMALATLGAGIALGVEALARSAARADHL